jgi:nucleoside 2-deoxyribosyltransferase
MDEIAPRTCYIASPFFNPEQLERVEWIKSVLEQQDIKYFSPKDECICPPDATIAQRQKVFSDNVEHILSTDFTFCITDGKDIGTIWEAGYAYAAKKPIFYFAETLNGAQFNLMLAMSGARVFTDRAAVEAADLTDLNTVPYEGLIE